MTTVVVAVMVLGLLVMAVCLPLAMVFLWIAGIYNKAGSQYLRGNIAAGDALKAKADKWADRFRVGRAPEKGDGPTT